MDKVSQLPLNFRSYMASLNFRWNMASNAWFIPPAIASILSAPLTLFRWLMHRYYPVMKFVFALITVGHSCKAYYSFLFTHTPSSTVFWFVLLLWGYYILSRMFVIDFKALYLALCPVRCIYLFFHVEFRVWMLFCPCMTILLFWCWINLPLIIALCFLSWQCFLHKVALNLSFGIFFLFSCYIDVILNCNFRRSVFCVCFCCVTILVLFVAMIMLALFFLNVALCLCVSYLVDIKYCIPFCV